MDEDPVERAKREIVRVVSGLIDQWRDRPDEEPFPYDQFVNSYMVAIADALEASPLVHTWSIKPSDPDGCSDIVAEIRLLPSGPIEVIIKAPDA